MAAANPSAPASTRRLRRALIIGSAATAVAATGAVVVAATLPTAQAGTGQSVVSPFDNSSGRGATVPFVEYEAEGDHATTNGKVLAPDYTQATLASEASGRQAVTLSSQGQYVEFTLTAAANAVDVSYALNQGASGRISVYVNGGKLAQGLPVTSRYGYLTTGNIPGSKVHHCYDDARIMFGNTVGAGGKVRLQVDGGDITPITIDVADFENVQDPAQRPAGSISVTDSPYNADASGGGDATNAFNQAISAARSQGKTLWVPRGTFNITSPLTVSGVPIRGAGPWYTVLHGTHLIDNNSASAATKIYDLAAFGEVSNRNDGSPDNFINGRLGAGSVISNVWVQHEKCGIWLVGADNSRITIENSRFLSLTADAINFNGTVTDSVVQNSFFRNTGDDALAMWSIYAADSRDTLRNNTIVQPNLANGIAIYGGTDITVTKNVIADTNALGSGIAISNQQFMAGMGFSPLAGTITLSDNTLIRTGAMNPNWGHPMGAMRFDSYDFPIANVAINVTGTNAIDSPYSVFEIVSGGGAGNAVTGLTVAGATISRAGTVVVQAETRGSATFRDVVATEVGAAGVYNCPYPTSVGPFALNLASGNSGWATTWNTCSTWPTPGANPTPSATTSPSTSPSQGQPGIDVARDKPVSANSVAGYRPGNAVDGDSSTYWESPNNAFPQTFTIDLGASYRIGSITMALPPVAAWSTRTQTLSILASSDGSNFTQVVGSAGYGFDPARGNTASATFSAVTARYVRLLFTANTGWPAAQLSELRVLTA